MFLYKISAFWADFVTDIRYFYIFVVESTTKNLFIMIGLIIWIIGLVLAIKAALEIYRLEGDFIKKLLFIILVLCTSWLGLCVYYFFAREKMIEWVK